MAKLHVSPRSECLLSFGLLLRIAIVAHLSIALCWSVTTNLAEDEQYQRGKVEYEAIKKEAKMPKYSKCWTSALQLLESGCKRLDDDIQHRLALAFSNCFFQKTGRETYACAPGSDIDVCVGSMTGEAYNTYTEFFTHTRSICYFLQAQIWHEETQHTVAKLSQSSARVARQLEDSTVLQNEMIEKQNSSIQNQKLLLERGNQLKTTLEDSKVDVQIMLKEFKEATAEQRASILDVFDRIQSLQSLVMGEFTGFYSLVFYTASLIVTYLLTSTPRTSGARFWLFFLMTMNVIMERAIVSVGADDYITEAGQTIVGSSVVYSRLQICRKVSCILGVGLLLVKAMLYEDLNKMNYELLQKISEENHQIKHLLQSTAGNASTDFSSKPEDVAMMGPKVSLSKLDEVDSAIGYESDSESEVSSLNSAATDHTFQVDHTDQSSENESVLTSASGQPSRSSTPSLLEELRFLGQATPPRPATPLRDITSIPGHNSTMPFDRSLGLMGTRDTRTSTPQKGLGRSPVRRIPLNISEVPSPQTRYNLRSRKTTPAKNPDINVESAEDFGRIVKHLAQVSKRNSQKTKHTVERLRLGRGGRYTSDES